MRFKVAYEGLVEKTIAIQTPADALYYVWSRFRDEFTGPLQVVVDEDGRGVRLAQLSFPVLVAREIEAESPAEAVRSFMYDSRVPSTVRASDITVEAVADPGFPTGAEERGRVEEGSVRADQDPRLRPVVERGEGGLPERGEGGLPERGEGGLPERGEGGLPERGEGGRAAS